MNSAIRQKPEPGKTRPRLVPALAASGHLPPRAVQEADLARRGVAPLRDATALFRKAFGRAAGTGEEVLLFPGAGHPLKRWPLVQFLELARGLESAGLTPVFVLGPAEVEAGLDPAEFRPCAPDCLENLEMLLLGARLAVGNDCGPMHLASLLGLPGVVLFGPTARRQWGPPEMTLLASAKSCRPCTRDTAGIACKEALCLEKIPTGVVLGAALDLTGKSKTGFREAQIPGSRL